MNRNFKAKITNFLLLPAMLVYAFPPMNLFGAETGGVKVYQDHPGGYSSSEMSKNFSNVKSLADKVNNSSGESKSYSPLSSNATTMSQVGTVNPATGQLSLSFPMYSSGGTSLSINAPSVLTYGMDGSLYGLRPGFTWGMDSLDTRMEDGKQYLVLSLANKGSYAYDPDYQNNKYYKSGLRYYPSEDVCFKEMSSEQSLPYSYPFDPSDGKYRYKLTFNMTGGHEYFTENGALVCRDDSYGNAVFYGYDIIDQYQARTIDNIKLTCVEDSHYKEPVKISYPDYNTVSVSEPGGGRKSVLVTDDGEDNVVYTNIENRSTTVHFENSRVDTIKNSNGSSQKYTYSQNIEYKTPDGQDQYVTAVSSLTTDPGDGSGSIAVKYEYPEGYGFVGNEPVFADPSHDSCVEKCAGYDYNMTIETDTDEGTSQKKITFNHFHLPEQTDTSFNGVRMSETLNTYAASDSPWYALPSGYDEVTQSVQTVYGTSGNSSGSITTTTNMKYNEMGQCTEKSSSVKDSSGNTYNLGTSSYTYTGADKLYAMTEEKFTDSSHPDRTFTTDNELDSHGKVTSSTYTQGGKTKQFVFTYDDPLGRCTSKKQVLSSGKENGITTKYSFDSDNHTETVTQTDPLGRSTSKTVSTQTGFQLSETDTLGRITSYSYDDNGLKVTATEPDKTTITADSSDEHKIITTSSTGLKTEKDIDGFGRTVAEYDNLGINGAQRRLSKVTYDNAGNAICKVDLYGNWVKYEYKDWQHRPTQETDNKGDVIEHSYDDTALTQSVTANGILSSKERSTADGSEKTSDNYGAMNLYGYYPKTTTDYNKLGEVVSSTNTLTGSSNGSNGTAYTITNKDFSYGVDGDVLKNTTVTSAGIQKTTQNTYNEQGKKLSSTESYSGTIPGLDLSGKNKYESPVLAYDAVGNVISSTDALGYIVTYKYDNANRVVEEAKPDGVTIDYKYDRLTGNLLEKTGPSIIINYTYVESGLAKNKPQTENITQYDGDGKVLYTHVTSYGYNSRGLLSGITRDGKTATINYDEDGKPYGRMTSYVDFYGNKVSVSYDDKAGFPKRIIELQDARGDYCKYQYETYNSEDPASSPYFKSGDFLKSETYSDGTQRIVSYKIKSDTGKWITPIISQEENISGSKHEYADYQLDNRDRIISITYTSDPSETDSTAILSKAEYLYNNLDMMISEINYGQQGKFISRIDYTYDVDGNVLKAENKAEDESKVLSTETDTYNNMDQIVSQNKDGVDYTFRYSMTGDRVQTLIAGQTTPYKTYSYDDFDKLIKVVNADGTGTGYEYDPEYYRDAKYDINNPTVNRLNYYCMGEDEPVNTSSSATGNADADFSINMGNMRIMPKENKNVTELNFGIGNMTVSDKGVTNNFYEAYGVTEKKMT